MRAREDNSDREKVSRGSAVPYRRIRTKARRYSVEGMKGQTVMVTLTVKLRRCGPSPGRKGNPRRACAESEPTDERMKVEVNLPEHGGCTEQDSRPRVRRSVQRANADPGGRTHRRGTARSRSTKDLRWIPRFPFRTPSSSPREGEESSSQLPLSCSRLPRLSAKKRDDAATSR